MKRETARLWLEPFAPEHAQGLHAMNADPEVMRFLDGPQTFEQTQGGITRVAARWAELGYGWWALIEKETGDLVGAACLQNTENKLENPLEIGWRLVPAAQGKGYATEAGQAAMDYAFEVIKAKRIISVAHPDNIASQKVMQRLGMTDIGLSTHYGEMCVTYEALSSIPTS